MKGLIICRDAWLFVIAVSRASLGRGDASLDCRGFAGLLAAWRGSDRQSPASQTAPWNDGPEKGRT